MSAQFSEMQHRALDDLEGIELNIALWVSQVKTKLLEASDETELAKLADSEELNGLLIHLQEFRESLKNFGRVAHASNEVEEQEALLLPSEALLVHIFDSPAAVDDTSASWPSESDNWKRYRCSLAIDQTTGSKLSLIQEDCSNDADSIEIQLSSYCCRGPLEGSGGKLGPPPTGFLLTAATNRQQNFLMRCAAAVIGTQVPGARTLINSLQVVRASFPFSKAVGRSSIGYLTLRVSRVAPPARPSPS